MDSDTKLTTGQKYDLTLSLMGYNCGVAFILCRRHDEAEELLYNTHEVIKLHLSMDSAFPRSLPCTCHRRR